MTEKKYNNEQVVKGIHSKRKDIHTIRIINTDNKKNISFLFYDDAAKGFLTGLSNICEGISIIETNNGYTNTEVSLSSTQILEVIDRLDDILFQKYADYMRSDLTGWLLN